MKSCRKPCVAIWLFAACVVLGLVPAPFSLAQDTVVPNAYATTDGDWWNTIPWSYHLELRYQQVYLGSEVGDGTITELRFRQDVDIGQPFTHTLGGVTILMSTTSVTPGTLSTTFADNLGADAVTVFSGDLSISSAASTAEPRPFDVVVPLDTPFRFDSGAGNLIIDVAVPDGAPNYCGFDASTAISVSRVLCIGAGCATSATASEPGDGYGLVTQFVRGAAIFGDGFESGDTSAWSN